MPVRFLIFTFLSSSFISYSQEREVFGRILDAETQKPLYGANVIVLGTTQGTITNVQGFFKFTVPSDKESLVISHIGYQTSKLEIPPDNKFLLKLTKEFQALNPLNINYLEVKDLVKPIVDSTSVTDSKVTEKNAEYPGGWEYFYNDVVKILKEDSIYKSLSDTAISHLRFSVEVDGSTSFISLTPESPICYNALLKKSTDFVWTSATQNNRKVAQYFDLPIGGFEEIWTVVEESAMPIGGMNSFYKYIGENIKYPAEARRFGVEGKVFVQFIIDKDGSIKDPKIIKGIGAGCDEEVLRLIKGASRWNPGVQRGKPVKQRYTMPINFSLGRSRK
jgi:TonB family protein